MRIREGDPLEIYTDREGEVIFKKYSPIGELSAFATEYAETLQKTSGLPVFVTDRDAVIAVAGASRREYLDKKISQQLEAIVESRAMYMRGESESYPVIEDGGSHAVSCAMPILSEGDIVGCILSGSLAGDSNRLAAETETKLIQTAGAFLGRQMEE